MVKKPKKPLKDVAKEIRGHLKDFGSRKKIRSKVSVRTSRYGTIEISGERHRARSARGYVPDSLDIPPGYRKELKRLGAPGRKLDLFDDDARKLAKKMKKHKE